MDAPEGLDEGMVKEEGGGWDIDEEVELPPELVSRCASSSRRANIRLKKESYSHLCDFMLNCSHSKLASSV